MLKLSLFELFFRLLPEGFLLCFLMYVLSNKQFDTNKLVLTGIILGITPFFIRLLPINFGVHTIISLIIYIIAAVGLNNINIITAISSGLLSIIILSICDFINFFVLVNLFKFPIETMLDNIKLKTLAGMPSLLLFALIVFFLYRIRRNKNEEVPKVV
ncbi:MAG: hypothetical protein K0R93_1683 [Anaerosolibacter sp.]|uniref:hypothetical protein n=1 Tax=Anaerosolibacter sp. TaxID=1872527 RepID=UPI002616A755|nr:hypothetical protein [Anaerosolibacter sp.]MDF2546785.1 hypothetical protein [Anaerosolibacter sp.]